MKKYDDLKLDIINSYEAGVTIEQAERLAAKFLAAQIEVGEELRKADLDARMRKTGVKAVKAAIYLETVGAADRKPSDTFIENVVNSDKIVQDEQKSLDEAEVERAALDNYLSVFREAHIYYRGVAKGRFE